jgi:nicotinate-nucleotide adenylyltransferase
VFVPTGTPGRNATDVTAAEDRYLMTVIATAPTRGSRSAEDIDRTGPTYTKDTPAICAP